MSFKNINFNSPQGSVFIGQGTGSSYSGTGSARPSVVVGNSAGNGFTGATVINGSAGGLTAVGYGAGAANRGIENTYIGDFAGAYHTDGSWNVFIGNLAGAGDGGNATVTVSTNSIFIGQYTGGSSSAPLTNAVAIGAFAKVNQSNTITFGAPAYNGSIDPFKVGIGTDTPKATLTVISDDPSYLRDNADYSLWVSSSGANSHYHLAVSTTGITMVGGAFQYKSLTKTEIQELTTPRPVSGQSYFCSDCSTDAVCVSTGGVNSFVRFSARTTACN